ncbi:MAG: OmpA family protein [Spirochaetaceae bacterium]|nr:MAG: OmpA family protein [Spirochaetaceae bacterium]
MTRPTVALVLLIASLGVATPALAETGVRLVPPGEHSGRLDVHQVTRWNMRRFEQGRYVGLTIREIETALRGTDGRAIVLEQTLRDLRDAARRVQNSLVGRPPGRGDLFVPVPTDVLPFTVGVPSYPDRAVAVGDRWQAPGIAWVDPLWNGRGALVPFSAAYLYEGRERFHDRDVHRISVEYALRWPPRIDDDITLPPSDIESLRSGNQAVILVDAATMIPLLFRTTIREEVRLVDGRTVSFDGFSLTWYRTIDSVQERRSATQLTEQLSAVDPVGIAVEETELGVRLLISDLRFIADSAVLLPEERPRLAGIADALSALPGVPRFLVIGHTALAGTEEGQIHLSIQRAEAVVRAMVEAGIAERRFLFEGKGAREPIADNATEAGRAANRRVEIFVLPE